MFLCVVLRIVGVSGIILAFFVCHSATDWAAIVVKIVLITVNIRCVVLQVVVIVVLIFVVLVVLVFVVLLVTV